MGLIEDPLPLERGLKRKFHLIVVNQSKSLYVCNIIVCTTKGRFATGHGVFTKHLITLNETHGSLKYRYTFEMQSTGAKGTPDLGLSGDFVKKDNPANSF